VVDLGSGDGIDVLLSAGGLARSVKPTLFGGSGFSEPSPSDEI
jgi:hypothetical protein